MLSRQLFQERYWKSSNIDNKLFNNISSKCYSIGYYFDNADIDSSEINNRTINSVLTINPNCFNENNEVSVFSQINNF